MGKRRKKGRGGRPPSDDGLPDLPDTLLFKVPEETLDLHGDTADMARRRVRDFVLAQSRIRSGKVVRIVTGRGARSPGGQPVLPGVVEDTLAGEAERWVEEWVREVGGGSYLVRLS